MISLKFGKSDGREITPAMQKVLSTQFHLDTGVAGKLQFVHKRGKYAGRQVHHISVFDPTVALDPEDSSLNFD